MANLPVHSVEIGCPPTRRHYIAKIDSVPVALTNCDDEALVQLVHARLTTASGLCTLELMNGGSPPATVAYRLRKAIDESLGLGAGGGLVSTSPDGRSYSLNATIDSIIVHPAFFEIAEGRIPKYIINDLA